ncbi:zinc finger CCCH-type antiviral protein 1-like isoform X2 [Dendropsophus ebraccatus]|uniref:zinc finger CCCH-type antiviral protein 1-like isoform X2 n=1 Tax=Dendropsophus ebraccatus TaxID=150705 RepID=UPI00383155E0
MSDPTASALLTKVLCSRGGRLPRSLLPTFLELSTENVEQILQDEPQKFSLVGELVLARSPVRICNKYLRNIQEEQCDKLHLCQHYLQGKCWLRRSPQCMFSHDIFSDHNQKVLKDNEIGGLNEYELKVLLFQNDNQLLPKVCVNYLNDSCDCGNNCSQLHICDNFLRGQCDCGDCSRSHNLLEFSSDLLLTRCHISELSIKNFQTLCTVKHCELHQSLKVVVEKGSPTALSEPRKRKSSLDVSQSKSQGGQQEAEDSDSQGASSTQSTSENVNSHLCPPSTEDDEKPVKVLIVENLKSSEVTHPLPALTPLDCQSSILPVTSPIKFSALRNEWTITPSMLLDDTSRSSPTRLPEDSLSASQGPSAPQPKPVTTTTQANASPVIVPMDGPSVFKAQPVATSDKLPPILVVNSSTVPSLPLTSPGKLINSPSFSQGNSVTTPVTKSYSNQPALPTITLISLPAASPSSTPLTSDTSLVNSPTKSQIILTISSTYSAQPVVTTINPVTSTSTRTSSAPSALHLLLNPPPNNHQITTLVNNLTTGPVLPQEDPVQSSVQSQPPGLRVDTNPDSDKIPQICLSNLWKYCKLEGRCPDIHYYLPYRWQIYKGTEWEDISNMEETEKYYCDPKFDRVESVDFTTMRSGVHRVRRLSTVSSVMKPSEYVLTTEWLWYWRDEFGTWTEYGHSNIQNVSSTRFSSDLENVYLADPTTVLPFIAGFHQYEINFQEMKQKNIVYKTKRDVRRRPRYLSFDDVKLLRGSARSSAPQTPMTAAVSPLKTDIYPTTWDMTALPKVGCKKVPIPETSSEFSEIVSIFTKTLSGHVVKSLWRLQNPSLWQVFQWQKEQMKQVNQGQDVNEMRLFHGTEVSHIDAICNQNFDWRICGIHGTVYGQGSYFARDASYAHMYSRSMIHGLQMMFVARVLVGDYTVGNPQMKRPPPRPDNTTRYYDSCVNVITNPTIFVVFEKHQIYPEYLLAYQKR